MIGPKSGEQPNPQSDPGLVEPASIRPRSSQVINDSTPNYSAFRANIFFASGHFLLFSTRQWHPTSR